MPMAKFLMLAFLVLGGLFSSACTLSNAAPLDSKIEITSSSPKGYKEVGVVFAEEWTVCWLNNYPSSGDLLESAMKEARRQAEIQGADAIIRATVRVETRTNQVPLGIPFLVGVQECQVAGIAAKKIRKKEKRENENE
jgi:hypothetical protein